MHDSWHELAAGLVFRDNPSVLLTEAGGRVRLSPLEVSGDRVIAEAASGAVVTGAVLRGRVRSPQDGSHWLVPVAVTGVHPRSGRRDRVTAVVGEPVADDSRRARERVTISRDAMLLALDGSDDSQPAQLVDITSHGVGLIVAGSATVSCGDRMRLAVGDEVEVVVEIRSIRPRKHEIRVGARFVELSPQDRREVERQLLGGGADDPADDLLGDRLRRRINS